MSNANQDIVILYVSNSFEFTFKIYTKHLIISITTTDTTLVQAIIFCHLVTAVASCLVLSCASKVTPPHPSSPWMVLLNVKQIKSLLCFKWSRGFACPSWRDLNYSAYCTWSIVSPTFCPVTSPQTCPPELLALFPTRQVCSYLGAIGFLFSLPGMSSLSICLCLNSP